MTDRPFPSEHHERLNILAGAWDTEIVALHPDGSDGEVSRATDLYHWMPSGQFLVHEVDAMMGGTRVQSTEIFGVDLQSGQFFSRSYDPDGSVHDFTSRIDGRAYGIDGALQQFAGTFSADGQTMTGQWRQRVDEAWQPFVRITLRKRPA